jgi:hypothetical protein
MNLGIFTVASTLGSLSDYFVRQDLLHTSIVEILQGAITLKQTNKQILTTDNSQKT